MPGKKLIIFDLDGTIIDTVEFHVETIAKACEDHGLKVDEKAIEEIRKRIGMRVTEIIKEVFPFLSEEELKKINEYKWEISVSDEFMEKIKPIEKAVDFINSAPDNCILAIFSSSPRDFIKKVLEKLGISDRFEFIIGWEDVKEAKPSPEGLLKAMEIAKIGKEDSAFVGDAIYDEEAAKRAGIRYYHIDEIEKIWDFVK